MKHLVALALCTLAAAPAVAQGACPVAADLGRGIVIAFADGSSETFRPARPDVVAVTGRDPDGATYAMELGRGFHLLSWEAPGDPSSRVSYGYDMTPDRLPLPVAGGRWDWSRIEVQSVDGPRMEPQSHVYHPARRVDIGGCIYEAVEAEIAYATSDNYVESIIWLPGLGISYLYWNETADHPRDPVPAVAIRAGK